MLLLARIVRTITMIVVAVIVAGILLYVLGANQSNGIVSAVMDGNLAGTPHSGGCGRATLGRGCARA